MRLYRRSKKVDLNDTIALCHFDLDHGRVKMALDRLRDLENELGPDAMIYYAEGVLRRDFLGQGVQAYRCFQQALGLNPQHALSACNAATLAPTEADYRRWVEVACRLSPSDEPGLRQMVGELENLSYQEFFLNNAAASEEAGHMGSAAAALEIALAVAPLEDPSAEAGIRRQRAQCLRFLDQAAETQRNISCEQFPTCERLSLKEALGELELALKLDEHDAELWNLKSAWCVLDQEYDHAIKAADNAIRLRPSGYPKPHQNKAVALMHLNRREEALAAAQVARQDAHAIGSQNDIQGAEALIEDIQDNTLDVSEETMLRMAQKTLQCAEVRANHFAGLLKCSDDTLCKMFDVRLVVIRSGVSLDYVGAVAQLLGYFPTEASVFVLRRLRVRRRAVFDFCFEALCYIAVQAEHVMRKDAARVLAMMLLDEPTIERIAYTWRTRLLGPSVVAPESYGMLAKSVERELEQLSPHLPTLLRFQAAPNHNERVEIENGMLKRLEGTPFVNDAATFNGAPVSKQGCGMMLFGIMMVAVILLYFFKIRR